MRRSPWSPALLSLPLLAACSAGAGGVLVTGEPGDDAGKYVDALVDRSVPRTDGRVPGTDGSAPGTDGSAPGTDGSAPGTDGSVPGTDGSVPGTDGSVPGTDAGPSGGDGGAPGTPGCGTREICGDGLDNDCNGVVDNGCVCVPGQTQRCYDGPPAQAGRGVCVWGTQRCEGTGEFGDWSACTGAGSPQPVVCGRMMDFRCNGNIDEGCECTPGATRSCYSGPAGTSGVGSCRAGTQTCQATASGSAWGACSGEVLPAARDLCDGGDQDCDGTANTNCVCVINAARPCYSGPAGTQGVGTCRAGTQRCVMTASGPAWNACTGEVLPTADTCDGVDRNCDGNANTGCTCTIGATRPCYSGPAGTQGVGVCRAGVQTCARATSGVGSTWGTTCVGEVLPGPSEVCGNMRDDNCNGAVDEGCARVCPDGYDLNTDVNNCGRCGNRCASGEACVAGVCVGNGQLRISMTWDVMGDLDLHVVPPCGTEIYYGRLGACGGALDVDSCPALSPSSSRPGDTCRGPENVFWAGTPARGTYVVCANPWRQGSAPMRYTITVTRGTTVLRTWTGTRSGSSGYVQCTTSAPSYVGSFTI